MNVLVVDNDLGFVLWVSNLLAEAGHRILPAFSCLEAFVHIQQFDFQVEAVLVNSELPGVADMLQNLARTHGPVKIVLIQSPVAAEIEMPAHSTVKRAEDWQRLPRRDWMRRLRKALMDAPPFVAKAG